MGLSKEQIHDALGSIRDVRTGRTLAESGSLGKVSVCEGFIRVAVACEPDEAAQARLEAAVRDAILHAGEQAGEPVDEVIVEFVAKSEPSARPGPEPSGKSGGQPGGIPGIRQIVAVGAGKGGVGKSTVALNLAVGLARRGLKVGLLDGDIYGPSVPTLLGLDGDQAELRRNMLQPFEKAGIKAMTIGKLVDPEKPLIWRGPMAHGAFKQLADQTEWGELDYLIIDLPPGTGDVPLTMSQLFKLTGAIIVCTPQKVAQDDAVRAARMFEQLNVEVLGVVENMSYFIGDDGKEYDIFGRGGAEQMAQRMGLPFLGAIPINMQLRAHSDEGTPVRNFTDAGEAMRKSLEKFVINVENEVRLAGLRQQRSAPELSIS